MFKALLFSSMIAVGVQSQATPVDMTSAIRSLAISTQKIHPQSMINWTINDSADYSMKGGIINGTVHMFVREMTAQGYWLQQDMKMGFLGDHKVETLIDKENGKILELLMDGQKQNIPEAGEQEIIDSRREQVTVPKGTFDVMWLKIHDKKENTDSQMWINPTIVPISGMIKAIQPSQMGEVTMELLDFVHN